MRSRIGELAQVGGVYAVVRESREAPVFLDVNPGGHFKGQDPTVPRETLLANWVEGAEVVYFGKANELRRRLREFADFGAGRPISHWGGRLIWQLADSDALLVAWKPTPSGISPLAFEGDLIRRFRTAYGKPPFANEPHRLGR